MPRFFTWPSLRSLRSRSSASSATAMPLSGDSTPKAPNTPRASNTPYLTPRTSPNPNLTPQTTFDPDLTLRPSNTPLSSKTPRSTPTPRASSNPDLTPRPSPSPNLTARLSTSEPIIANVPPLVLPRSRIRYLSLTKTHTSHLTHIDKQASKILRGLAEIHGASQGLTRAAAAWLLLEMAEAHFECTNALRVGFYERVWGLEPGNEGVRTWAGKMGEVYALTMRECPVFCVLCGIDLFWGGVDLCWWCVLRWWGVLLSGGMFSGGSFLRPGTASSTLW